ncbi:MAG TPA: hypothetical protein O0Y05_01950, partial [Methanocorpusculum sp.]|nr:hypothetical protein [Methanocorpusculum sp.]
MNNLSLLSGIVENLLSSLAQAGSEKRTDDLTCAETSDERCTCRYNYGNCRKNSLIPCRVYKFKSGIHKMNKKLTVMDVMS